MPRVAICDTNARMWSEGLILVHRAALAGSLLSLFSRIEGFYIFPSIHLAGMPGKFFSFPGGFSFLNVCAVLKHECD